MTRLRRSLPERETEKRKQLLSSINTSSEGTEAAVNRSDWRPLARREQRTAGKQLISSDCKTGRCSAVKRLRNVSMSPLNRSLPAFQPRLGPTENLHRLQAIEAALRQQRGHVVHPGEAAARSVRQKRLGVEAGLVFDEQLELLVLDGLR